MSDFDMSEILCDPQTGAPQILPKGTFVYRLNGRDRQKSASYYTPEVLTRSTVKYTLKSIIDEVRDNKRKATELLELKILEPAMGAAAFQNEVINQLAEAYLLHQQRQQRENGLRNWRISPDQYRDELQKVKAYIATHNVYGVDLNPTAVELGKLSLWLNVIHKDMETPFFANRICVGNAVIGAWLKVYGKNEVYGISERYGSKLKPNKWWEKAPHKIKFFANRVNRSVNEIYHFLLPDANMLGVRSIKEQKRANPDGDKRMAAILKDWTAPIDSYDFQTLQRLSAKIDILLKDYFTDQISIEKYTNNRREIWDGIDHSNQESLFREEEQAESYARKQSLFDTRYGHNNAYRKLKLAMDYWCSLWFWEYKDADSLPSRQEYWADIEALLDVDDEKLDKRTRKALDRTGLVSDDTEAEYNRISEDESQIVAKTQEEMLTAAHGNISLFSDDDPLRLKIVCRLAERYRFFHPMLEFLEVFWLRDGFDIICGNPPWLPIRFKAGDVLMDAYPEIYVKKWGAAKVEEKLKYLLTNENAKTAYENELYEYIGTTSFSNAPCNYFELGGKSNLFKSILLNSFALLNDKGFIGLLHPESVYDETEGASLRKILFHRLRYHFQYQNELLLFAEVDHHTKYGCNIYGKYNDTVNFDSIQNLFHPSTIDGCYIHSGEGLCVGKKDTNGQWSTQSHKGRIIRITPKELSCFSKLTNNQEEEECTQLMSIHAQEIMNVLETLALFPTHVNDYNVIIDSGLNETGAQKKKEISSKVCSPNWDNFEMIYCGPNITVCNPYYKSPRLNYTKNSDYDVLNIVDGNPEKELLTKYVPSIPKPQYLALRPGFYDKQNSNGNNIYTNWWQYYKVGVREMVGADSERTLQGAILPPNCRYVNTIISACFEDNDLLLEFEGIISSIILDFYTKIGGTGTIHVYPQKMESFPLGIHDLYKNALFSRVLLLNCVTDKYKDLWRNSYNDIFKSESWSIQDNRLSSFCQLGQDWSCHTPLLNWFERRQALIEIDIIVAMALGLKLKDIETLYSLQFGVLNKYENDTWYDANGMIVFTNNAGLVGVGLDRKRNAKTGMPGWEDIRGEKIDENTYRGTMPTHTHTIDPAKSELYGGQQQTFVAPYTRCDRIADYRRAWAHFEKIFNK